MTKRAIIEIDGLRIRGRHGVFDQERRVGNDFEVSVSLVYPPALRAVESDNVEDTLSYARVIEIVRQVMAEPSDLLEHVAGRIYKAVIGEFPAVTSGRITVSKPAPPVSAELTAARFTLEF